MKKILYLIIIVCLSSCSEIKKHQQERENEKIKEEYESLVYKAKTSVNRSDTIYLGFRFGMTKKEFDRHMKLLVRKGVVSTDYLNRYTTKLSLAGVIEKNARMSVEYYKGKLCKMIFKTDDSSDYVMIFSAFKDANQGNEWIISNDVLGNKRYTMFKDNMIIEFEGIVGSTMSFIDAHLIDSVEIEEKIKKDENINKYKL